MTDFSLIEILSCLSSVFGSSLYLNASQKKKKRLDRISHIWPEHKKDTGFLKSLPGASEKLQIFNADLSDPESFNAPIEGCIGVLHVATPVDFEDKEPEEIVTQRSINGALGILKACLNSKTVKRVVYTSSASTVLYNGNDEDEMDESFWSEVDFIKAIKPLGGSYVYSKTLTERAVVEFGEKHGLDVVTIIPSFVVGPFICPKFPSSVRATLAMILGMFLFICLTFMLQIVASNVNCFCGGQKVQQINLVGFNRVTISLHS